jgi:xylan 1,4-beta-xylosidase
MKQFDLDAAGGKAPLEKYWELCVGSCHATTALRADWQEMLARCRHELGFRYVRFHGLLDDDMSVAYSPMMSREIKISYANIDKLFDFLLSIDMKPFVEIGFMPTVFAGGPNTIFHYKGNTSPPRDYDQWAGFIEDLVKHLIDRYSLGEVRQWFFEVWNEPNLGGPEGGFWSGDQAEYFKLYKVTAQAIKQADPLLKTGGPATSNNAWIPEFIAFCKANQAPLDFITTHHYPTDVILGYGVEDSPNFTNPMSILMDPEKRKKLAEDPAAAEEFAGLYTTFQKKLWEGVDRGVLTQMTRKAAAEAGELPLYYTEWGSLSGLPSDGSFGASFIAKTVLDNRGLVKGYSFWTFCDVFEEGGQDGRAFHGGYGLLTQQGIPKAPYRVFQLLHQLGGSIYDQVLDQGTVNVYALEKEEAGALQLLLVNHHSLLHPIETEEVHITLRNCKPCLRAELQRVDDDHASSLAAWEKMGKPAYLSEGELHRLQAASCLVRKSLNFSQKGATLNLDLSLPPMGTALVTLYLS